MSLRRLIARGYQPQPLHRSSPSYLVRPDSGPSRRCDDPGGLVTLLGDAFAGGIGFILPTFVGRGPFDVQLEAVRHVHSRLCEAQAALPEVPLVFFVGMQHRAGEEGEARSRLERILALAPPGEGPRIVGLYREATAKFLTLNPAIDAARALRLAGVGWVDDDIWLEDGCLRHLIASFREGGGRGAVGATKQPRPRRNLASRLLYHLKRAADPAGNYPHGCCILVDTAVVADGIPERYGSDDGFVCFELLRPEPAAACVHQVGATAAGDTVRRINRMLLHHHLFLADYPPAKGRYYFREILFHGLWPLAPWDRRSPPGRALAKWALKIPYFLWFAGVGLNLAVRGALGRPKRRKAWGSGGYERPESGATP
jgi:hypothetical protein